MVKQCAFLTLSPDYTGNLYTGIFRKVASSRSLRNYSFPLYLTTNQKMSDLSPLHVANT